MHLHAIKVGWVISLPAKKCAGDERAQIKLGLKSQRGKFIRHAVIQLQLTIGLVVGTRSNGSLFLFLSFSLLVPALLDPQHLSLHAGQPR